MESGNFRQQVYLLMEQLPSDKVTTYGDIAAMCGHPYASRIVGGVAHYGNTDLPWHRLVNRFGGLAAGFPGSRELQESMLLANGIKCTNFIVDNFEEIRWKPNF